LKPSCSPNKRQERLPGGLFQLQPSDKEEQVPSNPKALDGASEQRIKSH
jgi:hypothetical protein